MKKRRRLSLMEIIHGYRVTFLLCFSFLAFSGLQAQLTTKDTLSLSNFLQFVQQYHPVSKQIGMMIKSADASYLSAKGNFDPKLYTQLESKTFQGKEYFNMLDAGVRIPTWVGLDVKAGFENNRGTQINPENTTPVDGLVYTQITVPLLQGLMIDERRTVLRQADLSRKMSVFEMTNALNDLFYQAGKAYFDWQLAEANLPVFQQAYDLSKDRMRATKRNTELGDRPGIDTVEAKIQLQDRYVQLLQAQNEVQVSRLQLAVFLWDGNSLPLQLNENTFPEDMSYAGLMARTDSSIKEMGMVSDHPYLKTLDYKIQQLEIDRKWKREKLKPQLNLSFSPITDANRFSQVAFNQNKWGVGMYFPLFLRKERGDLQLARIKIQVAQWERDQKRNEIMNKVNVAVNRYANFNEQQNKQEENVGNYERLWLSEKKMFEIGESSLFMINSREISYMNSKVKLNELRNKYYKSALEVQFARGQLAGR